MGSQRSAGGLALPANARCRLTVRVRTFLRHLDALLAAPRDALQFKPAQEQRGSRGRNVGQNQFQRHLALYYCANALPCGCVRLHNAAERCDAAGVVGATADTSCSFQLCGPAFVVNWLYALLWRDALF